MLKIFTVKYSEKSESFPDSAMSGFLADKEILRWESHFFERKGEFFWTVLAEYRNSSMPVQVNHGEEKLEKKEESYKTILNDADWPLFKMLKEWRGEESKKEGVPPYIICNNMQLARISVMRPTSLNALQGIDGIGKAKIEKYGKEILRIVSSCGRLPTFDGERDQGGNMSGITEEDVAGEGMRHE
ncbi:HRDC domain-containing protein [Methanosarcina sp.]|uniref:HRDC domain-containing protein n=1 Tax=Methanosarcina sp. TaxID=2213 RepID=UPI002C119B7D|nr:HRDC domain-containing protein [Methanosarcina sp.]HOW13366.1 HRDC domain-containing protein [Methanosarcina sp.]